MTYFSKFFTLWHHIVSKNDDYKIHNLDNYNLTTNCLHLLIYKLLKQSFNKWYRTILPAKNFESAFPILCIVLQ